MSVSEPFIRRPIATSLLGIALFIGGALGYWALPVSALPQVDFPTVQVTTQLPGGSPDVIASLITAPLERQLGQIPSLSSMTSTSSFGVSQISLQFDLNRDIDGATQDVQAAINAAAGVLPRNLPYPPTYAKVNPADAPVLTLALTSDTISLRAMSDLADTILAQRLSQLSGVGRVAVLGGLKPAVRVQADLARLAAYGISMEDLRNAIAGANVSGPKGSLDGAQQAYTIAANDQIAAAEAYKPIIIAYRNGAPVTIGDVAVIVDGLENDRTGGWYQGTPAVIIDIQRQPGANVIEVVRQIREEIPKLQRAIPAGVNLTVVSDRTVTIRASVRDVQFTLILSVVLVTLVVLLFLRSLRATLIAGVALPLSLITSFGIMYFAGFSLDNLSLMAFTIGTGFVVDDAIVMIENIVRHMENGESAMQASLRGAKEIGFTVISLTVSLIAVFIPLLFMSGLVGRMFREFALTLTIAVVTSAIISLTLTPMMCSRLLKYAGEEVRIPGLAAISHSIDRMVNFYHRTLLWVLERQRATLLVTFATIVATLVMYVVAPKGFLPLQDTASITAVTQAGPDVSFAEMQSRQGKAADAIKGDPDVIGVVSVIGAGSVNPTTNVGRLVMTLKPRGERRDDVSVVVARLKRLTASIPGMTIYFQPVQDVQHDVHVLGGGRDVLDDVAVESHEADAVALPVHQVRQAGGQDAAVFELGDAAAAKAHRLRHVEQHGEVRVGVRLVLLDVEPIGAAEQLPVDAPDVVSRGVPAMLGEVDRRAEVRRSVHTVDEAVDDRAGDQFEVAHACEDHGVHEPRTRKSPRLYFIAHCCLCGGLRPAAPPCTVARGDPVAPLRSRGSLALARSHRRCHIPDRGIGTASSSLSTSASLVTPSDCAWKFVSTRCRRMGCARARTSSKLTW